MTHDETHTWHRIRNASTEIMVSSGRGKESGWRKAPGVVPAHTHVTCTFRVNDALCDEAWTGFLLPPALSVPSTVPFSPEPADLGTV